MADLAHKTRRLVQASARQEGLGRLAAGVTFDTGTVQTLRETPGSYEAKVFNLVRGLRQEIHTSPDTAPVLRPIRDRAERVLTELETRQTSGDDAMDQIEKLVREREDTLRAARHSGLSPRADKRGFDTPGMHSPSTGCSRTASVSARRERWHWRGKRRRS